MKQRALFVLPVLSTAVLMTACGSRYDENDHAVTMPETTRITDTARSTDNHRGVGNAVEDAASDIVRDGVDIVDDVVEGGRDIIDEAGDDIDDAVHDADNDMHDNDGNYRTNHKGRTDTTGE